MITYAGLPGSCVGVFLEGRLCALLFLSIVLAYRTDISCRFALHSVRCIYFQVFASPAAFSPAGRSFLTTDLHATLAKKKQALKLQLSPCTIRQFFPSRHGPFEDISLI